MKYFTSGQRRFRSGIALIGRTQPILLRTQHSSAAARGDPVAQGSRQDGVPKTWATLFL